MLDESFWKKYLKVYDFLNLLIPYQELLETICDELDIKKGEKILEAGCGTGNLALKIKERGAEVVGLDNCREALEVCQKKDPDIEIVLADLTQKLPFPDNYFDKIASNNTLYTIPEEKQLETLKELKRVLKPGGKIVIANPKRGWKPLMIYIDGIEKNLKKEEFLLTFYKVLRMIVPTVKILYYNRLIKREGKYHFFEFDEQRELLEKIGFFEIAQTKKIYANQGVINSAYKRL